jgi:hypothetical protein
MADISTFPATAPVRSPGWLADGRRLLYSTGSELRLLDTVTNETATVYASPMEFLGGPSVSADARKMFLVISKPQSDILMATLRAGMF